MQPIANIINTPQPPPSFVATALPGNNTLRVPPSAVPPTVSNVEINNNSKGGSAPAALPSAPLSVPAAVSAVSFSPVTAGSASASLSIGAQTTFIAQLASQDSSPQAQAILAEYEKLVAFSRVKYLPSNAGVPEPEPSNVFGRILQQEKQVQAVQQVAHEQKNTQAATETFATHAAAYVAPKAAAPQRQADSPAPAASRIKDSSSAITLPRALGAYVNSIVRNNELPRQEFDDSAIEAV